MVKNETISADHGNIALNKTFLKEAYINTNSEAKVTDLSIWDKALSYNELVKWTTCR